LSKNKRLRAVLTREVDGKPVNGKDVVFDWLADEVRQRTGHEQRTIVAIMDGDGVDAVRAASFEGRGLRPRRPTGRRGARQRVANLRSVDTRRLHRCSPEVSPGACIGEGRGWRQSLFSRARSTVERGE